MDQDREDLRVKLSHVLYGRHYKGFVTDVDARADRDFAGTTMERARRVIDQLIAVFDEGNPLRADVESLRARLEDAERARGESDELVSGLQADLYDAREELEDLYAASSPAP